MIMKRKEMSRRQFLKRAALIGAGAMSFPCFVRPAALGKDGRVIPSDRITVGCVGMGGRGTGHG